MTTEPDPVTAPQTSAREPGQHISITGGDSSPIHVTAPFSVAEAGGTAHAGTGPLAVPGNGIPLWRRSSVVWTAVGSIGAVASALIAFFTLVK